MLFARLREQWACSEEKCVPGGRGFPAGLLRIAEAEAKGDHCSSGSNRKSSVKGGRKEQAKRVTEEMGLGDVGQCESVRFNRGRKADVV